MKTAQDLINNSGYSGELGAGMVRRIEEYIVSLKEAKQSGDYTMIETQLEIINQSAFGPKIKSFILSSVSL